MKAKISQADIFPTPLFEIPVPEMAPYHEELLELFGQKVKSGEMVAHSNGYGYQSKINLFDTNSYPQPYLRNILLAKFHTTCADILSRTVTDFAPDIPHHWVNTFNAGWAVVQTNETWKQEIPWHTHLPAVLSGCYYVSTSLKQNEGVVQFTNPNAPNIFQPKFGEITPKTGHMIIFPSGLSHRPTASPGNQDKIRLALCMDGHWTSMLGNPDGPGKPHRASNSAVSAHSSPQNVLMRPG